jgi:hypothetical protein
MFMAQNSSSGVKTRHADRYHFINEDLEDGIIKIEFVKSAENELDIFRNNVNQEIYKRHMRKFLQEYIASIGRILEIYPLCRLSIRGYKK